MIVTEIELRNILDEEYKKYILSKKSENKKTLKHFIKKLLFSLIGFKIRYTRNTNKIPAKEIKRVLIFRYDAIGDYITTNSVVRWLKKTNPNIEIDIISSERNHILAVNDPLINKSYPIKYAPNLHISMLKILKYRKRNYYDVVFSFVYWKTTKSAILARMVAPDATKITVLHQHREDIYGLAFDKFSEAAIPGLSWTQRMVKCVKDTIEPYCEVSEKDENPYIFFGKNNFNSILSIIIKNNLSFKVKSDNILFKDMRYEDIPEYFGKKYVVVNIAGSEQNRNFSVEKVTKYCNYLLSQFSELVIFVSGGIKYEKDIKQIITNVNSYYCQEVNIGLIDFICFCSGAYFVVSPDTGVVHFVSAAKVPIIVLYAEICKIIEWFPHNEKRVMLLSPNKESINYIPDEELIEGTKMLIDMIEEKE